MSRPVLPADRPPRPWPRRSLLPAASDAPETPPPSTPCLRVPEDRLLIGARPGPGVGPLGVLATRVSTRPARHDAGPAAREGVSNHRTSGLRHIGWPVRQR